MSETQAAVQARLIGEIFLERGLIGTADLEEALEKQRRTGDRLGEILVADFGVSRLDLASVLAERWAALERAPAGTVGDAGEADRPDTPDDVGEGEVAEDHDESGRRPIGEIFVERGIISDTQLARALATQAATGKRLGEALIEQGSLSRLDLAGALAEQWAGLQKLRPPTPKPKPEPWQERAVRGEAGPETARDIGQAGEDLSALRSAVGELELRLASVEDSSTGAAWRDEIAAAAASLTARLAGLEGRVAEIAEGERGGDEIRAALAELRDRPTFPLERIDALEAKAGDLGVLSDRADGLRADLEGLGRRLDDVQSVLGLADRVLAIEGRSEAATEQLAGLTSRIDELARTTPRLTDVEQLASRVDALADLSSRLEGIVDADGAAIEDIRSTVERLSAVAPADVPAHRDEIVSLVSEVERALSHRVDGLESRLVESDVVAERLRATASRAELANAVASLQRELGAISSSLGDVATESRGTAASVEALLTGGVSRPELIGLAGDVRAQLSLLEERIDDVAVRLASEIAERTDALRDEIVRAEARAAEGATAADRLASTVGSEVERALGATDARLARLEESAAAGDDRSDIEGRVRRLETTLVEQQSLIEAQGASVEKAVRKGLDRLGRHIAGAERTYLDATESLRKTVSALGEAIAEPVPAFARSEESDEPDRKKGGRKAKDAGDTRPAKEKEKEKGVRAASAPDTFVAFVPTPDGYRLVELAGRAPAQGDMVETEAGVLTVRRVSRSPLPFDERVCAYLERP